jgi:hypothetical protein
MTTKVSERVFEDEGKLIVHQQHDFSPVVERAKTLSRETDGSFGESKLVGLIPMKMWAEWAKEAGVSAADHGAMREIVARKMNDPDFANLRVWQGKY